MKIKDLIEQLQKLDREKNIGIYNKMDEIEEDIEIVQPSKSDVNIKKQDYVIY